MEIFSLSVVVLFVGGLLPLVIFRFFRLMKAVYTTITVVGCLLGLYGAVTIFSGAAAGPYSLHWLHFFQLRFFLDSLSAFFLVPIFGVCPLAVLYSFHYMDDSNSKIETGVHFFFTNVLIIAMALVVAADTIASFVLAWELMSVSSFMLVIHDYQNKTSRRAGYIYLLFTQTGAAFIFAAMGLAYGYSASFDLVALAQLPEQIKPVVFMLALVGFGSKAGMFPLHIWLPHAHPAAPSNISAIMSGVMIKMGIYGIVRFYALLGTTGTVLGQTILLAGMVSGVLGVVYALGKHDLKKLLAYHSVENIGIILIGLGIGMVGVSSGNMKMAVFGFVGGLLHVLNHAVFKSLLFLGAGAVLKKTGVNHIDQLGGLLKRMPITGRTFMVGSVAISGLPPFNGFVSEFLIYYGAFQGLGAAGGLFILSMLAILSLAVTGGLAAACFTKVVGLVFLGEPRTGQAASAVETRCCATVPMAVLAGACVVIGIFPEPFVQVAFMGLKGLVPVSTAAAADLVAATANLALAGRLFAGLFLCCVVLRKIFYLGKKIRTGPTWGCGFTQPAARMQYTGTSYAMSVVKFFSFFVHIRTRYSGIKRIFPDRPCYETRVDDIAETVLADRIVTPMLYFLGKLRWIQHGHIQLYIGYIIVTIIVLLPFI
ncbi:proton-conducting transporter transmembrane domain-containing protein [Desulforhopalus singaporensis]|uniref:Hydrogenase-4 component B n=1 Tax=Desulforhopalus singaporensis TaxID=91360 RepID=A0A1H0SBC5_9BACT|nr:proton-conducting transporter membrane subunit [Desulforhopalus singaporensis]SDP39111.1 hypothetical protein SAMN05660330_02608 [Desulforhopalus singaporensis]